MKTPFNASFCSLNARGLNQARKRRQLFRWLHNYKFDVIFLQETYSTQMLKRYGNLNGEGTLFTVTEQIIQKVLQFSSTPNWMYA